MYEHEVRGQRYLYFWHYETVKGRRRQVKDYLGPARAQEARTDAIRRCDAYFRRVGREVDRLRQETLRAIARGR